MEDIQLEDIQESASSQIAQHSHKQRAVKIKVWSLKDHQISQLMEQLARKKLQFASSSSQLVVSFKGQKDSILKNEMVLFSEILQDINISHLFIRNRYAQGDQMNPILLLEQFQNLPITELTFDFKKNYLLPSDLTLNIAELLPKFTQLQTLSFDLTEQRENSQYIEMFTKLGSCTSLKKLNIHQHDVQISESQLRVLINSISLIKDLNELNLSVNGDNFQISDIFLINQIPQALKQLKKLFIVVQYSRYQTYDIKFLQDPFNDLYDHSLEQFSIVERILKDHSIGQTGVFEILLLPNFTNLKFLHCSLCYEGNNNLSKQLDAISKFKQLQTLEIRVVNSGLTKELARQFNQTLLSLKNLKILQLNLSSISHYEEVLVHEIMRNCNQLTQLKIQSLSLHLSENFQKQLFSILPSLSSLQSIQFYLGKTQKQYIDFKQFGQQIKSLKHLLHVKLDFNTSTPVEKSKMFTISLQSETDRRNQQKTQSDIKQNDKNDLSKQATVISSMFRRKKAQEAVSQLKILNSKLINYSSLKKSLRLVSIQLL